MTSCEREWLLCLFMMDVVGLWGSIDGSLCETKCGFLCVSVLVFVSLIFLFVIVLLVSVCEWWFGLVWECDVFKCFPRGQPPVGLLSRNALRCEISLWFLFWFDRPTRNHELSRFLYGREKVKKFYDVKANILPCIKKSWVWRWNFTSGQFSPQTLVWKIIKFQ